MAKRKKLEDIPVPNEVYQTLEDAALPGIPIDIVRELFSRMKMPEDLQVSFWQQAARKKLKAISGKVYFINTNEDGTVSVNVYDKVNKKSVTFHKPGDMTDDQLKEFKRAQNNDLKVTVLYQEEEGKKTIKQLHVFSADSDEF